MKKDTKVPVKLLGLKIKSDMDSLEVFGLLSSDLTNIANYVVTTLLIAYDTAIGCNHTFNKMTVRERINFILTIAAYYN